MPKKILILLLIAAALILFLYFFSGRNRDNIKPPPPPISESFYDKEIQPILADNASHNSKALEAFRKRIEARFEQYRNGLEPFAQDITSWKSRYHIVTKGTGELFSEDKEKVERYVTTVFEEHIVGSNQLEADIKEILLQFKQDVDAARNQMLSDVEVALSGFSSFEMPEKFRGSEGLFAYFDDELERISKSAGSDGVTQGSLIFVTGLAVEEAVRITVTWAIQKAVTSLATTMAASAATGGGATATATAAGGGGGSLAGPAGTVIGIGAGLITGSVIDWWMTDRLKDKLVDQGDQFLKDVEAQLLDKKGSLHELLKQQVEEADALYKQTMEVTLLGEARP